MLLRAFGITYLQVWHQWEERAHGISLRKKKLKKIILFHVNVSRDKLFPVICIYNWATHSVSIAELNPLTSLDLYVKGFLIDFFKKALSLSSSQFTKGHACLASYFYLKTVSGSVVSVVSLVAPPGTCLRKQVVTRISVAYRWCSCLEGSGLELLERTAPRARL